MTAGRSGRGTVRRLTRELLARLLEEAVRLDAHARREIGDAYSHEAWSAEHFLLGYIRLQGEKLRCYAEARGLEPSHGGVRAEGHDYLILSQMLTAQE